MNDGAMPAFQGGGDDFTAAAAAVRHLLICLFLIHMLLHHTGAELSMFLLHNLSEANIRVCLPPAFCTLQLKQLTFSPSSVPITLVVPTHLLLHPLMTSLRSGTISLTKWNKAFVKW
jgi:hypothetical protein